ncbi:oligosaccharide flippase family protein [Arhodomonas sp. AD133]|uniref:oligosaccharide flippase family protein n=1 Tax=Arhodomonas sp. AD133 TaxID=3415009 RepID=UPI003EBE519F
MSALALKLTEVVLGLVVVVLLARVLGASGYGIYTFVFALVSLTAMPARMGLPALVVRETARGHSRGDWGRVVGMWHWANQLAFALSATIVAVGFLILWLDWVKGEALRATLTWGIWLVPLLALAGIRSASLRGLRHPIAGLFPDQVLRPGLLVLVLLAIIIWPDIDLSPAGAMFLTLVAAGISFLSGIWLLARVQPRGIAKITRIYDSRRWLAAVWPMALTQGFQQVNRYADVLLLGLLSTVADVGIYRVAAQGAMLASLGLTALNRVIAPYVAHTHAQDDLHRLQNLARSTARASLIFASLTLIGFAVLGEWLLAATLGEEFGDAHVPLLILAAGQVANAGFGSTGVFLNMTGHEREVARALAATAIANVGLNLVLIPLFGAAGAASATATTLLLSNLWLWGMVRSRLGIRSSAF